MAKNVHKVNKKVWNRWRKQDQAIFNRLWKYIVPELLPTDIKLSSKQMSVLRWNICFTAAYMNFEYRDID